MAFRRLVFIFLLFLPFFIFGQTESEKLTLDDCIQLALANNFNLNLAKINHKISKQNYLQSYSSILPRINFSYSSSKYEQGPSSYLGGEYVGENPFRAKVITGRNYYAEIRAGQTIFDGGRSILNIYKSKYDKMGSSERFLSSRQNIIVTVRQLYMDLLKQKKLLAVKKQAVERSRDQLDRVRSMYEVGSVAQVDVFRSEVNLGADRIALLNQENTERQARQSLNLAIGREPDAPLEIDENVKFEKRVGKLDSLVQKALQNNPDIKAGELSIKSSLYDVRLAKSAFLPNLNAFYSYSRRVPQFKGLYEEFNREYSWAVGLSLSWNVFNGFSDYLNVQKAKLGKRYAEQQLLYDKLNLKSKVTNLYNNLNAINEIIEINKTNLESAREDYRLAQESYRLGSGTLLDLRDAQVKLATAEQILVAAEFDAYITYAELQQALGDLVNY